MIISLTGFMGCGKSSVGKELSSLLSCPYIDLDSYIESAEGMSVGDIFRTYGEPAFRSMEYKYLKEILIGKSGTPHLILSLGGGTILSEKCADLLKAKTTVIYLQSTAGTLIGRLESQSGTRPLLQGSDWHDKVKEMLEIRTPVYRKYADMTIDTGQRPIRSIAAEILSLIRH